MRLQTQEFLFEADRDTVLTLFTGEQRSRTVDVAYGEDTVQITLIASPVDTGGWGIFFFVQFKNPEVIVSENSRTLKVAMIELAQSRKNECRAILYPLPDTYHVRPHLQGQRDWAYGVGQDIAAHLWRQTLDEWLKQPAERGMPTSVVVNGNNNGNIQIGSVNNNARRDINVGGDLAGRDKVTK